MRSSSAPSLDHTMTQPTLDALPSNAYDPDRLIAEHRERIIALEAHGLPSADSDGLWDVMGDILAQVKRMTGPTG